MHHGVTLEADAVTVLPPVAPEGKDQACKILLPAYDAFIFICKSKFGVTEILCKYAGFICIYVHCTQYIFAYPIVQH